MDLSWGPGSRDSLRVSLAWCLEMWERYLRGTLASSGGTIPLSGCHPRKLTLQCRAPHSRILTPTHWGRLHFAILIHSILYQAGLRRIPIAWQTFSWCFYRLYFIFIYGLFLSFCCSWFHFLSRRALFLGSHHISTVGVEVRITGFVFVIGKCVINDRSSVFPTSERYSGRREACLDPESSVELPAWPTVHHWVHESLGRSE